MAKKKFLLKSDEMMSRADVAGFLHQVSEALAKGNLALKQGEDLIELEIPEQVEFEVEVTEKPKKKGKQISVEFEIEWLVGDGGAPLEGVSIE